MKKSSAAQSMTRCLNNGGVDKTYTPSTLAIEMIELAQIEPHNTVLDPCAGSTQKIFYNNLPPCHKDYCEIEEGIDFYKNDKFYDIIIGNPPYSELKNNWLQWTMQHCNKFIYVIGVLNADPKRFALIESMGFGITMLYFRRVYYWFGFSLILVCERGKPTMTGLKFNPDPIFCDQCGTKCKRGRKPCSMNYCPVKQIQL